MRILVVDSNNDLTPDARLPRVFTALGRYRAAAEGFRSPRRQSDEQLHDLTGYDLALIHASDALLDDAALYLACERGTTPCVLFTGGVLRASARSERLISVSDAHVLARAEDGIAFWELTGRLDLTAWTEGLVAARRVEVHRLCEPLRRMLRADPEKIADRDADAAREVPQRLARWIGSPAFAAAVKQLEDVLAAPPGTSAAWLSVRRDALDGVVRRLVETA